MAQDLLDRVECMMKKGNIPIPSQIAEILGEQNVADIYDGDSSEDSSVEVWKTNVKAYTSGSYMYYKSKRTPGQARKRQVIHEQLKTFQSFYTAQEKKEDQRRNKLNEGESGYDSRSKSSSKKTRKRTTRKKAEMPSDTTPDSLSSQSDMFSTGSPVKVKLNDSIAKKKVVGRRETSRRDMYTSSYSSSSEDESESERSQRLKPHSDAKVVPQRKQSSPRESENSNSDSSSNTSNYDLEKPPSSCLKKEQQNDSTIKGMGVSKNSVENDFLNTSSNKGAKESSPFNQNTFKKNVIPTSLTLKKDSETETSSSEDDYKSKGVPPINISPFITPPKNNIVFSKQSSIHTMRESDNSGSGSDSGTSEENKIPDHKQPPNPNLKHSSDADSSSNSSENESKNPILPSPKKEKQNESDRNNSYSISRGSVLKGKSGSSDDWSSDSDQSEHEIIAGTQESSQRITSLSNILTKQNKSEGVSRSPILYHSPLKPPPKQSDEEVNKKSSPAGQPLSTSSDYHKGSPKSAKETSLQRMATESRPHKVDPPIHLSSALKIEKNIDSSSTSDSSDSDQEESTNAKSQPSLNNHQASLPQEEESRENCRDSKDTAAQQSPMKGSVGLTDNSRKRKADSISSSDGSHNEHKNKVRKIMSAPENVPFNSTRNPGVEETSFPGSDISVIPKMKVSSTTINYQNTMGNQETPRALSSKSLSGSPSQKPGQLSITNFARPISTASLTTSQNNYEILKQEYFDAGFSNLKELCDFESYEGLLEEDLYDDDNEVYVVQCPKEVDPISLVGKEIDVSSKESMVDLRVAGGQTVRHDVYCDLSDSEFGMNIVVPSRNKKKFTLNTVPVNGRLTIVESVYVPEIDEFDVSSPPTIPLPDNLRARNSFIGSDESTAHPISGKSKRNKSRKSIKGETQESSSLIPDTKYESIMKRDISEEKLERRDNKTTSDSKLDVRTVHDVAVDESGVKKKKKKKKKHELEELSGPTYSGQIVGEEVVPPLADVPEHTVEKKKKKKKNLESDEMRGAMESERAVIEYLIQAVKAEPLPPPTDNEGPIVGERKKKKKKKKCDLEELNDETLKKKKHHMNACDMVTNPDEDLIRKKKKKMKREKQMDED